MLRCVKKWWSDNALLIGARAFMGVLYPLIRLKEATAPPEKQARMRAARRKLEERQLRAKELKKQIGAIRTSSSPDNGLKMLDATEKWLQEFGSPESLASVRETRTKMLTTRNEHATIDTIRADAGDDEAKLIDSLRDYVTEHPGSSLGEGALRKAKRYDEAITIAKERLPRIREHEGESGIRAFTASTTLATLFTESGQPREAILLLEKLLAEQPNADDLSRVMAWKTLADAYEKAGNWDEARKNWKRVASYTEFKESSKQAKERLSELA